MESEELSSRRVVWIGGLASRAAGPIGTAGRYRTTLEIDDYCIDANVARYIGRYSISLRYQMARYLQSGQLACKDTSLPRG
jgi:hypothetical protein